MRRLLFLLALLLAACLVFPVVANPVAQTFNCNSVTEIPVTECQALLALYTSTNGPGWADHTDWAATTTPCSWRGVTCSAGYVTGIDLYANQLSGSLPPQLGNLTHLQALYLYNNQLSGKIPSELGNLTGVESLWLSGNQLSGSIPSELGNLTAMRSLRLENNRLSGSIPSEFGSFTSAQRLRLNNNQLSGEIPATLVSLTNMSNLDLRYNRLTATDPALVEFLNNQNPDWAVTQTVAPTQVHLTGSTLTWTPIVYTGDGGYYIISYLNPVNGAYTVVGQTADKTTASYTLSGLSSSTTYYFAVQSYTPAHGTQQNNLTSGYSQMRDAILSAANVGPKPAYYEVNPLTLTWNAISWAAGYEVQVATDKTFPPAAVVYTKADLPASTLSVSAAVPRNGVYYWRVRALRASGSAGAWSTVDSFVVDAP